jgi:branched-chain amino acid aminotransferase
MALPKTEKIWHNGKFIKWDDATIHVLSHVVSYGSAVFEGIRCYDAPQGPAIFRLREHMQRLLNSAYIYRMEVPFTLDALCQASLELVRANKVPACYVRPIVLRGYGDAGVNPMGNPVEVYLAVGNGESISAKKRCAPGWIAVSARGIVPRPTRFRKWPRPPRTI